MHSKFYKNNHEEFYILNIVNMNNEKLEEEIKRKVDEGVFKTCLKPKSATAS